MLKNDELIKKMTKEEKINLIYNLSQINDNEQLPSFNMKKLSELAGNNFSENIENLLYSWNENLLKEYGKYNSIQALKNKVNVILTERLSLLPQNHQTDSIISSEDPLLLGSLMSSFYGGLKNENNSIVLDYDLNDDDLKFIDKNKRVVNDFFLSPLNQLANNLAPDYVLLTDRKGLVSYPLNEDESLYSNLLKNEYEGTIIANEYSTNAPYGSHCLALNNNTQIDLDEIEETEIDTLLDNLISMLNSVNSSEEVPSEPNDFFTKDVYAQTSVLLKNKNQLLPLTNVTKLFVLTNINFETSEISKDHPNLTINKHLVNSFSKNGLNLKILNKYIDYCNVLMVVLDNNIMSIDEKVFGSIINRCKKLNKKVVLFTTQLKVLNSTFANHFDSILFNSKFDCDGIFDLLTGTINPSGRLIKSIQSNSLETTRLYNKKKIGSLVGYRYLDTNNEQVSYLFGSGLSYSKFNYSNINVTSENVIVTVTNVSNYPGYDTLQVYIGVNNSHLVRPKRELKAFKKIYLKPGEKKQIIIDIPKDAYNFYNEEKEEFDVESQFYSIYLSSSFDKIIYTGNVYIEGSKNIVSQEGKLDDYLLKNYNKSGSSLKFKNNGRELNTKIFAIILLVLFLGINGFVIWNDGFYTENYGALMITLILVNVVFILGFILLRRYSKIKSFENYEEFDSAIPVSSIDDMFDEYQEETIETASFDEKEQEVQEEEEVMEKFNDNSLMEYIDDFNSFLLANGLKLDQENLNLFIASFASNKLIFIKNDNKKLVNKLVNLTNLYLNDHSYEGDNIVVNPTSVGDLFVSTNENQEQVISSFKKMVDNANLVRNKMYLSYVELDGENSSTDFLLDLDKFFEDRNSSFTLNLDETLTIFPSNLWTIVSLENNYQSENINPTTLKNSITIPLEISECEEQKNKKTHLELSYVEFVSLVKSCKNDFFISELNYKKIDEIQKYVGERNEFRVNAKINYSIEDFLAILLYAKEEELEALDSLFAYKIIPLSKALLTNVTSDDVNLEETIEKLLDDSHQERSLKMI